MKGLSIVEIFWIGGIVLLLVALAVPGIVRARQNAKTEYTRFESRYGFSGFDHRTSRFEVICDTETNNLLYLYNYDQRGGLAVVRDGC